MPLLIDCYNLLHATMPPSLAGLDENRLCHLLLRSPWRNDAITLFCDGLPKPHAPESPVPQVTLVYSGGDRSADDLIAQAIDRDSAPRRLAVVTDDRQIQKTARRRRCQVIPCGRFVQILTALAAAGPNPTTNNPTLPPQKSRSLSETETLRWLKRFGVDKNTPLDPTEQPWPNDADL